MCLIKIPFPARWLYRFYKNLATDYRFFLRQLKMVFLNYVRLLFFASLCAASLRSAATRELANEIRLQFHLWSNSTAVCDAALSSPGAVSVAVSYRTDLDSDNWIPLESSITIQTPVVSSTLSCKLLGQINYTCRLATRLTPDLNKWFWEIPRMLLQTQEVWNMS